MCWSVEVLGVEVRIGGRCALSLNILLIGGTNKTFCHILFLNIGIIHNGIRAKGTTSSGQNSRFKNL